MTALQLRHATAAMLVVSAALFLGAVQAEHGGSAALTAHVQQAAESEEAGHSETSEASENTEVTGGEHHGEVAEAEEQNFGVNLESPVVTWGFVAASVLLAVALVAGASPLMLWLAVALGVGAALLDLREVALQAGRGNSFVLALAGLTAAAHAAVALLGFYAVRALAAARSNFGRDQS